MITIFDVVTKIFSEEAFKLMERDGKDQSIIVSGITILY